VKFDSLSGNIWSFEGFESYERFTNLNEEDRSIDEIRNMNKDREAYWVERVSSYGSLSQSTVAIVGKNHINGSPLIDEIGNFPTLLQARN
jgi:hypothetical protein